MVYFYKTRAKEIEIDEYVWSSFIKTRAKEVEIDRSIWRQEQMKEHNLFVKGEELDTKDVCYSSLL